MQRTRPSPSALRSPLMRCPLGVIKQLFVLSATAFLALSGSRLLGESPLSPAQLDGLAVEALKHTPEHVHWAKGATFSWVLFLVPADPPDPELMRVIRARLATRYQVYEAERDLPEGSIRLDEWGKTYLNGFAFTVTATRVARDTIEITYDDHEGPLAASQQIIRYRWSGSRWKVARTGPLIVS
jgi:hypothetical protein